MHFLGTSTRDPENMFPEAVPKWNIAQEWYAARQLKNKQAGLNWFNTQDLSTSSGQC